jgi:hypothetical protein
MVDMLDAVIFTVISVMLFIVFLKQRKKPRFKLPATACVLSSAIGTSLAWLAYIVNIYQKEAFYLSLKLLMLGGVFIFFPIILFGDWFVYYLLDVFNRKPHEQRILFHIGKIGIRFIDIIRVIALTFYSYVFLRIMLME